MVEFLEETVFYQSVLNCNLLFAMVDSLVSGDGYLLPSGPEFSPILLFQEQLECICSSWFSSFLIPIMILGLMIFAFSASLTASSMYWQDLSGS